MEPRTSEQQFDVFAGVRRGELVDDVQGRLVIRVPDVHVNPSLQHKIRNAETCNRILIGHMRNVFITRVHVLN